MTRLRYIISDQWTKDVLNSNTIASQDEFLVTVVKTAALGKYPGRDNSSAFLQQNFVGFLSDDSRNILRGFFDGTLVSSNRDGKATAVNYLDDDIGKDGPGSFPLSE